MNLGTKEWVNIKKSMPVFVAVLDAKRAIPPVPIARTAAQKMNAGLLYLYYVVQFKRAAMRSYLYQKFEGDGARLPFL